jgi:thioredoxin 1
MHTTEITEKSFEELVEKEGILLIDWWAPWCGPCRAFGPVYEKVAARNPDIVFGKVNTEDEQALAAAFEIRSIPTLMVFRDGVLLFAQPGMLPEAVLEELIGKVRGLEMGPIMREIEEKKQAKRSSEPQAAAQV